jgi:hypothetical protein
LKATNTYIWTGDLGWRWSKAANVTLNGRVRYAVEKRKLYVMDDEGKEHEIEIIKKTLRSSGDK